MSNARRSRAPRDSSRPFYVHTRRKTAWCPGRSSPANTRPVLRLKLHFVMSSVPRPGARGPARHGPTRIGARRMSETDDLLPCYDGSEVESGSLSSPDSSSGSQGSANCSSSGSSFVLVTGSFSCHGLPPPASASPLCPPGVRLGLRLLFSCKPFTMFSMDFSSPAELPPDVRPAVGVGELVGGLGGGDLGLSVLLPGVTVSNADPCDGAGKVYGANRCPFS